MSYHNCGLGALNYGLGIPNAVFQPKFVTVIKISLFGAMENVFFKSHKNEFPILFEWIFLFYMVANGNKKKP